MTDPALARDTGDHGRYYARPGTDDLYISVTNVTDSVKDRNAREGLIGWAVRLTAEFWRDNLPRAVAASMDPEALEEFVTESKDQRSFVAERASLLGSMIHARAEAHVLDTTVDLQAFARGHQLFKDDDLDLDYVAALYDDAEDEVDSYLQWLSDFRIDLAQHVEASECTVASNTYRYAGTMDLLVWLPLDPATLDYDPYQVHLWLVDVKSSRTQPRTRVYPGAVLQLSGYRWAEEVWLPDGTIAPMPGPIVGAAILNVRRKRQMVCQAKECGGRVFNPGGPAASHVRARGHQVVEDFGPQYGFIPLAKETGGETHAAFVAAVQPVRWLHAWQEEKAPKPLDLPKPDADQAAAKPHGGRKAKTSRTRNHDPLALAGTTTTTTEVPF